MLAVLLRLSWKMVKVVTSMVIAELSGSATADAAVMSNVLMPPRKGKG